jgi:hypothetical protein
MESPNTNTSLAYWKGRINCAKSALEHNKGTPFEAEYRNALDYARYQVARLETRYFTRKSPQQRKED